MLPEFLSRTVDWGWVQWCRAFKLPEYAPFIVVLGIPALGIARGIYSDSKWTGILFGALYMFCAGFALSGTYWMFLLLLLLYAVLLAPWHRARRKVLSRAETNRLEQQVTEAWNTLMTVVSRVSREACKPYADAFAEGELEKCRENWTPVLKNAKYTSRSGAPVSLLKDSVKEDHRLTKKKAASSVRLSAMLSVIFVAAFAVFFLGSGMLKDLLPEKLESRPAESVQNETETEESGSAQGGAEVGEVDWSKVQSLYADKLSPSDAMILAQFADTPVMKQIQGLEAFMQSQDIEVVDFHGAEQDENGLICTYRVTDPSLSIKITICSSDRESLNKLVIHVYDSLNLSTSWDRLCHDFYHLDAFALPQDLLETLDSSGYREEWEVSNDAWSAGVYYAGIQTEVVVNIF